MSDYNSAKNTCRNKAHIGGEMKTSKDEGYDFPCGDSHSRIDYAYIQMKSEIPKPGFRNNHLGEIWHPTKEMVEKYRLSLLEQIKACDLFLGNQ